jgi:hypothetical protein
MPENSFGIVFVRSYQNVNIFGGSRLRVNRNRKSSHDKIFNALLVQNGQEFFELWVPWELRPSVRNVLG